MMRGRKAPRRYRVKWKTKRGEVRDRSSAYRITWVMGSTWNLLPDGKQLKQPHDASVRKLEPLAMTQEDVCVKIDAY